MCGENSSLTSEFCGICSLGKCDYKSRASLPPQIDFLQQKNADLQAQLDDALSRLSAASGATLDLDARNSQLERSAHRMEAEKEVALAAADKNIFSAKVSRQKCSTTPVQ